jgi:hypothetical protein
VGDLAVTKDALKSHVSDVLTTTETAIKAKLTQAYNLTEAGFKSEILNTESTIKTSSELNIRYRTYPGATAGSVTIDVYDPNNVQKKTKGIMKEVGNNTGIYEYAVKFGATKGPWTIVCADSVKGTLDALVINVIGADIESLSGGIASIMGTTSSISGLGTVVDSLTSTFGGITTTLDSIGSKIVKDLKGTGTEGILNAVQTELVNVSQTIKTSLASQAGVNLDKILNVSEKGTANIVELKNTTQKLEAAMELSRRLITEVQANTFKPQQATCYVYGGE